jgi:hypothetical protein
VSRATFGARSRALTKANFRCKMKASRAFGWVSKVSVLVPPRNWIQSRPLTLEIRAVTQAMAKQLLIIDSEHLILESVCMKLCYCCGLSRGYKKEESHIRPDYILRSTIRYGMDIEISLVSLETQIIINSFCILQNISFVSLLDENGMFAIIPIPCSFGHSKCDKGPFVLCHPSMFPPIISFVV